MGYGCAVLFFFFNDTATTEIYTLSLHDALPIYHHRAAGPAVAGARRHSPLLGDRSEEHTSELQSPCNLVCRLLLEKKKKFTNCSRLRASLTTYSLLVPRDAPISLTAHCESVSQC